MTHVSPAWLKRSAAFLLITFAIVTATSAGWAGEVKKTDAPSVKKGEPDEEKKGDGGLFGGGSLPIVLMIVMALFFFVVVLPGQRRRQKEQEALMAGMKKNDEVVTASGIIGIVHSIKDGPEGEVVLKIDDNARMRVLKSAIVRINKKEETPAAGTAPPAPTPAAPTPPAAPPGTAT